MCLVALFCKVTGPNEFIVRLSQGILHEKQLFVGAELRTHRQLRHQSFARGG